MIKDLVWCCRPFRSAHFFDYLDEAHYKGSGHIACAAGKFELESCGLINMASSNGLLE